MDGGLGPWWEVGCVLPHSRPEEEGKEGDWFKTRASRWLRAETFPVKTDVPKDSQPGILQTDCLPACRADLGKPILLSGLQSPNLECKMLRAQIRGPQRFILPTYPKGQQIANVLLY